MGKKLVKLTDNPLLSQPCLFAYLIFFSFCSSKYLTNDFLFCIFEEIKVINSMINIRKIDT